MTREPYIGSRHRLDRTNRLIPDAWQSNARLSNVELARHIKNQTALPLETLRNC